jgi:hypothetical protein
MTKTDARLALSARQRRFDWQLARDEHALAAAKLVAGRTHDLYTLIQIVQLASLELDERCDATGRELLDDLRRAAGDARNELNEMMAATRPEHVIVRGAPVGAVVEAALAALRPAIAVAIDLAAPPDTATQLTAEELEHLLIGLALDRSDHPPDEAPVDLVVRQRTIEGKPWLEIVRSSAVVPAGDRFELRAVAAIARRAGGELTTSERRGGGEDLVVALPVV